MRKRIGSLFSGIGGIDLGFQQADFSIAGANEYDKNACKTYKHNFPDTPLFECDICNLNVDNLKKVDILAAGFPCQPFSVCGKQKGFKDIRGSLFYEIMRIADTLKPPVIFLENVANLTEHDNGKTFNVIYNELVSRDYFIRYIIADACNYGIPQHRTRIYIVAFKSSEACETFKFPVECELENNIFNVIDRTIKSDESYYLSPDSKMYKRLDKAMIDTEQIYRFSDYGIQTSKDGISFTLKANMGTWYNRIPYIRDNFGIRKITPLECLALQGFPKNYDFPQIPLADAYKQCGNTVCVPMIYKIGLQIQKVF